MWGISKIKLERYWWGRKNEEEKKEGWNEEKDRNVGNNKENREKIRRKG